MLKYTDLETREEKIHFMNNNDIFAMNLCMYAQFLIFCKTW